ncbi:MAG: FliM/FliN family flagellar motor switch protein [Parvularculaceae bacterium]
MQNAEELGSDGDVIWKENDDANGVADLLGFDFAGAQSVDRSGLRALINSAFVPHRRLPMLDVILDRTARLMTTSLRQLTDENFEAALDDVSSTRFGDFLQSLTPPAMIAIGRAEPLDASFLVACDAGVLIASVDALLGGRRGRAGVLADERGFTAIELAIAQRVFATLIGNIAEAFQPVAAGEFKLQRLETTPRFAVIAQEASVCALAKFRVRFEGGSGKISALFPYAALDPIREVLARALAGETRDSERAWAASLAREAAGGTTEIDAVIAERAISLGELKALKPGDTLVFRSARGAVAEVRAGGALLAHARIGRSGDFAAVKIGEAP